MGFVGRVNEICADEGELHWLLEPLGAAALVPGVATSVGAEVAAAETSGTAFQFRGGLRKAVVALADYLRLTNCQNTSSQSDSPSCADPNARPIWVTVQATLAAVPGQLWVFGQVVRKLCLFLPPTGSQAKPVKRFNPLRSLSLAQTSESDRSR